MASKLGDGRLLEHGPLIDPYIIHLRNHPQMVRLHKVTGEFDIADIRDSFMRQYCTPQLNLVLDTAENNEDGQSYMKTVPINLVKSLTHCGRSGGLVEKNTGVAAVIR